MSEDIDALIEKKEAELSSFLLRMEECKIEFIKETVVFASDWYRAKVKEYVAKYPQVTLNMLEEKIARMKTEVSELIKNNQKIVEDLDDPKLWWHQKPNLHDPFDEYTQLDDKYPIILDRAVRHSLGRLGIILEEFRFNVTVSGTTGSFQEFWFDHSQGEDGAPIPYYPHLLTWTREMQQSIRKYNMHFTQAIAIFNDIQKLKDEKKQQQALSRWDSI
jgi:hypothetical protein